MLSGVGKALEDASYVDLFVNTLVSGNNADPNKLVTTSYTCDPLDFMMDGDNSVLEWCGSTQGIVAQLCQFCKL